MGPRLYGCHHPRMVLYLALCCCCRQQKWVSLVLVFRWVRQVVVGLLGFEGMAGEEVLASFGAWTVSI